jgi:hypothetical protein
MKEGMGWDGMGWDGMGPLTHRSSKPVIPTQQESLFGEVVVGGRWGGFFS